MEVHQQTDWQICKRQWYLAETIANNKSGVTAKNIRIIFHQELEVSYCCPNCNKKVKQQTDQLIKKIYKDLQPVYKHNKNVSQVIW